MTKRVSTHNHLLPLQCPHCAAPLLASTGVGGKPKRGDLTLCAHCGGVAEFAASGLMRVELEDVPDEMRAEVDRLRAHVRGVTCLSEVIDLFEVKS